MGKQRSNRVKKILGILLVVCFLMSITAMAVGAIKEKSKYGPKEKVEYASGLRDGKIQGKSAGSLTGSADGKSDCRGGSPFDVNQNSDAGYLATGTDPYSLGFADGYNTAYPSAYKAAYVDAYDACNYGSTTK